jgi:hypothetical protein
MKMKMKDDNGEKREGGRRNQMEVSSAQEGWRGCGALFTL